MSEENAPVFENILEKLEDLVQRLETGGLSLDEALKLYEEGVALTRVGNQLLEGVERRIIELQKDNEQTKS